MNRTKPSSRELGSQYFEESISCTDEGLYDVAEGETLSTLSGGTTEPDEYLYKDKKHASQVLSGLNTLRQAGSFCDVSLSVEDCDYPCHRVVLASFSPYFKAMFSNEMAERSQSRIVLNGVESDALRQLLEYAYTSEIAISQANVQALLSAANLLDVTPVREACCTFLEHHIDETNCLGIYTFAELHSCIELRNKAKEFACRYITEVFRHDEFLKLPASKLVEFLSCDSLDVEREEHVFEAVLSWLEHSPEARKSDFELVFEHVRLPLMSPYYLLDKVAPLPIVAQSTRCSRLLEEAKSYHLLPDRRKERYYGRSRPRCLKRLFDAIVLVGGEDEKVVLRNVDCISPQTGNWIGLASLPFAISKHGVVVTGHNVLYLAGGEYPDGSPSRAAWRFDPALNSWTEVAPMNVARSELGLAALDGYVYAVGGWQGTVRLGSAERYHPSTNYWEPIEPMDASFTSPAVAAMNGLLYVAGGVVVEDGDGVDLVQCYDPNLNFWRKLAPLPIPRSGAVASAVNGRLYVMGGWNASSENMSRVDCYDPEKNVWESRESMKECRYKPGVAVLENEIYVCGGEETWDKHHDSIEVYDPEKNSWRTFGVMPHCRSWLGCAAIMLPIRFLCDK